MNGDSSYPDDVRQYDSDPRSPFYEGKDDENSDEFIEKKREIFEERVRDLNGDFMECFTEMADLTLGRLGDEILKCEDVCWKDGKAFREEIGMIIWARVHNYCMPSYDEVIEALEKDGCE